MIVEEEKYLSHYGVLRKSGRYPYGSGDKEGQLYPWGHHPSQNKRNRGFLDYVAECRQEGMKDTDIAKGMGVSIASLRDAKSIALNEQKLDRIHQIEKLGAKGMSNGEIAKKLGLPGESSVRTLRAPGVKERAEQQAGITNMLKAEVDAKGGIDVGRGVESHLGISPEKLRVSVSQLREQGYELHPVKVPQQNGKFTEMKVLAKAGTTQKEFWQDPSKIHQIDRVTDNDGKDWSKKHDLVSIHPDRVAVKYGDEGGEKADGVIYVRDGVPDVSLGNARYAQVRIKVGDGHYLKGMAMYKEDLPDGVDLVFNTNKTRVDVPTKLKAMKELEKDSPDYPFGSVVRPQILDLHKPSERVVSAMNIVNEEGNWNNWSRNISAQALSKQTPGLVKKQLDRTFESRKAEYDEIMSLTNPVVKKKLLETFADSTDKSAVHLKAAALDRQNWHVILPITTMKSHEIYAPKYNDGEIVALIRYPHGGTFEIPELRVNNKQREARKLLGLNPKDAVGIHHSVAERLSGADFDGDTVLVIPNDKRYIKTSPALSGLKDFNSRGLYKLPEGRKFEGNKQALMGDASNLITDMTLRGASHEKIARAVKYSMVVIDAEKHDLDHKRAKQDFSINDLKREYQGVHESGALRGASTLISRAKSRVDLPQRKERPYPDGGPINKETGQPEYVFTDKKYKTKSGKEVLVTERHKKLAVTDDANELVSVAGTPIEKRYAEHSNRLKGLANQARLSMINTPKMNRIPSSTKAYASEVSSLQTKLALARQSAPRERQAQIIANKVVAAERAANPGLEQNSIKKLKFRAQEEARARMGVKTEPIKIDQKEWNAIQAGAISENVLSQILDKADLTQVRVLATPRPDRTMTTSKTARAKQLLATGRYTRAEVAKQLGVSVSTLDASTTGDAEESDDEFLHVDNN